MSNATNDLNTQREEGLYGWAYIAAAVEAFKGVLALLDANMRYNPASPYYCAGVVTEPASDMGYDNTGGLDDAERVRFEKRGIYAFALDSTNPPVDTARGMAVFAKDNQTLSLNPFDATGAERPYVGLIDRVESSLCWVNLDPFAIPAPEKLGAFMVATAQTLAADGVIVINRYQRIYPVVGSGGSVTLTENLPDGTFTGQVIVFQGNGANKVKFSDALNCKLAGDLAADLGAGDTLSLLWNGTDWLEIGRSMNS